MHNIICFKNILLPRNLTNFNLEDYYTRFVPYNFSNLQSPKCRPAEFYFVDDIASILQLFVFYKNLTSLRHHLFNYRQY
jgi:hypothetical protein